MRTYPTKQVTGVKRGLGLVALTVFVFLSVLVMSRPASVISSVPEQQAKIFVAAAREAPGVRPLEVLSVTELLTDAGFDAARVSSTLLKAGVPARSFNLAAYQSGPLTAAEVRQRTCLADAVYYEARNQPVLGRFAVADVVLNRVHDRRFPSTICGVVYQGQNVDFGCQFSFACDGSLNRNKEPEAWKRAERLADLIYRGFRPPVTGFATFYHADYVDPYWSSAFTQTHVIGDHVFYRAPDAIELAAARLGIDPGLLEAS